MQNHIENKVFQTKTKKLPKLKNLKIVYDNTTMQKFNIYKYRLIDKLKKEKKNRR